MSYCDWLWWWCGCEVCVKGIWVKGLCLPKPDLITNFGVSY
jgi:hypothetical protein